MNIKESSQDKVERDNRYELSKGSLTLERQILMAFYS